MTLSGVSDQTLINAVAQFMRSADSKFFPTPGQIYALAHPEDKIEKEDTALIAEEIIAAARSYGWDKVGTERARRKIGPLGWAYIESVGGWELFIKSLTSEDQISAIKGQCRLALLGLANRKNQVIDKEQNKILEERTLKQLGVHLKTIEE